VRLAINIKAPCYNDLFWTLDLWISHHFLRKRAFLIALRVTGNILPQSAETRTHLKVVELGAQADNPKRMT
jgi:hypothetical protein